MSKSVRINAMVQCKLVIIKVKPIGKNPSLISSNLQGGSPNYYRNTFHGPEVTNRDKHIEHATFESGMAARHETNDDDNYSQPRIFYQVRTTHTKILQPKRTFLICRKFWMIVVVQI